MSLAALFCMATASACDRRPLVAAGHAIITAWDACSLWLGSFGLILLLLAHKLIVTVTLRLLHGPAHILCVLFSKVLANIRLVEHDYVGGWQLAALLGGFGSRAEAQRYVRHRVDHNALVLRRILRDAPQPRLEDVIAVQVGELRGGLHPYFVLGILRQVVQRGYVQAELVSLREFTETGSQAY